MSTMTPLQADCLAYIQFLLAGPVSGLAALYKPSDVMAHIEIESAWRVEIGDEADTFGSCGLMQVLPSTAIQMGVRGSMLNPENSILAGMRYLDNCLTILQHYQHGGKLQVEQVVAAYNEGPGNVMRGRQDPHYVTVWTEAQKKWAFVDAIPMDPKAAAALNHWNAQGAPEVPAPVPLEEGPTGIAQPTDPTAAPVSAGLAAASVEIKVVGQEAAQGNTAASVEIKVVGQEAAQGNTAAEGQSPDGSDQQGQGDGAEALNAQELEGLHQAPAGAAVDPAAEGNASLNGA